MKNLYDLRVAKVIDEYDIVVNAGWDDEVSESMKFLIYSLGEEIIDPETNESLGNIEIVKGAVRVLHLQQKLFTARSNRIETVRVPKRGYGSLAGFSNEMEDKQVITRLKDVAPGDFVRRLS